MTHESHTPSEFLQVELRRRIRVNPRYSLRAFARQLELSPGELSEILRGRRTLSLRSAVKVSSALSLNRTETRHLLQLVQNENARKLGKTIAHSDPLPLDSKQLDEDLFQLVSEWYHFAIINLIDLYDFRWSPSWVAQRLGLTRTQAQLAMDLLARLGLVEKKGTTVKGAKDVVLSPTGVPSKAVRNYHKQILKKAEEALELQSLAEREFSGIGFAVDPAKIPSIKKEISDFQDQLLAKYSRGKRQDVYFLEMALFKISQGANYDN